MVVGARFGSVDFDTGKSITNLEFIEARAYGVPAYVFVYRDVLAQLRVWRANPDSDYSSVVDSPRVFEFIDTFQGTGQTWTFDFLSAADIERTLRQQLAFLVNDALNLRKKARGQKRLIEELSGRALTLALLQEEYWEIKLFAAVFEEELDQRASLRREINFRLASSPTAFVSAIELGPWIQDRLREGMRLGETASTVVNKFLPQIINQMVHQLIRSKSPRWRGD